MSIAQDQQLPDLVHDQAQSTSSDWLPILLATLIFAALSVWGAVTSDGFLEADSCTHYLYARFALEEPHYLVNVWGRPLVTTLYAVPAALTGRIGVRLTSLALALICAWGAYRIARLQNYRWPALAFIFTVCQPLVFLHSFSELTELPFATVIILAFWAYRLRWFWLMAILVGISPTGRPEGFGFIGLAAAALVLHRRSYWLPLLAIPLLLWNHFGWELYGRPGAWWLWLPDNWPYAAESMYSPRHLFHFLLLMPVVTSPVLFPATIAGVWRSLMHPHEAARDERRSDGAADTFSSLRALAPGWLRPLFVSDHATRCQMLIAIIPVLIFVGHSLLSWLGKMASNGELRYMLVVAPFWGLLSAKGWEWIFTRFDWRIPYRWAAVAALVPIIAHFNYKVLPLGFHTDWKRAEEIAAWYQQWPQKSDYPMLAASHPGIFYFLDVSPTGRDRAREWHEKVLLASPPPPGTLVIWDEIYGVFNSDTARSITADELRAAGWIELQRFAPSGDVKEWVVFLSPARVNGRETRSTNDE